MSSGQGEAGGDRGGTPAPDGSGDAVTRGDPLETQPDDSSQSEPKKKRKNRGKKKPAKSGNVRGIETMFRMTYRTHLVLSQLADQKANIMISINGIIISILIGTLSGSVAFDLFSSLPAAVLLLTCVGSLVFAILAARPRVSSEILDADTVRSRDLNILFFGNFVHLEEEEFVEGIQELMNDPPRLYAAMARDVYGLGSVLDRKYRLISYAYTLFMGGLTTGVILFVALLVLGVERA